MEQMNIFECLYDTYKIKKPIRLIEFFAGIGSQAKALENLKANFEHWKICEWAIPSILAYNEIHQDYLKGYGVDYSKDLTKEQLVDYLHNKGISSNYNEPMTFEQIKRQSEGKLRDIYNAIISENNLVNIQQTHGKDLHIEETNKYDYILSYSFPCQDLSNAGKGRGMAKGSGTRSGMLWEVERILLECEQLGEMPQILLMENVPQVIGEKNIEHFKQWQAQLERLGYTSYCEILNAKNYGIPQNRQRAFMVSILGDYNYTFPKPMQLKLRLKDMLEDAVNEKYYLSDKMINFFENNSIRNEEKGNGFRFKPVEKDKANIAKTITTRSGGRMDDNFIKVVGKIDEWHQRGNIYDANGISPTLCCTDYKTPKLVQVGELDIKGNDSINFLTNNKSVKETIEGKELENGDFLDFYNKNVIKSGIAGTITTRINASSTSGVVVSDKERYVGTYQFAKSDNFMQGKDRFQANKEYADTLQTSQKEGVVVIGNYSPSGHSAANIVDSEGIAPIVMGNHGTITATEDKKLRIRKLTPKECYRLMGFDDLDKERASKVISDSMIYHTAGDSIVVNVLMSIFEGLL